MFTAITLITLAAGVGANTVVFSVLEGVLLKPLPYPKPDELIGVWLTAPGINLKEPSEVDKMVAMMQEISDGHRVWRLHER